MSTQISLQLSEKMLRKSKTFARKNGFDSLQDFIRDVLREKLYEDKSEDLKLLLKILKAEAQIARGECVSIDSSKSFEEIDKILMGREL